MATVNLVYKYPYWGFSETTRFGVQVSTSRKTLNGCYTYPMEFNNTVPGCKHIKVKIEVTDTGSGTVLGRSWDFMVCKSNGSWVDAETFTLPDTGEYTVDCDINSLDIKSFAFVPTSNPGSSRTWESMLTIYDLVLTESFELQELETGKFQYGVFVNRYNTLYQNLHEVFVNVDGVLVPATNVLANVDGTLLPVRTVYSAHYTSEAESMWVFAFTPTTTGTYCIREKRVSGDHELRLYSSDFTELSDGYFYDESFELTAGTLYYISVMHYYGEEELSESYLQIYKED